MDNEKTGQETSWRQRPNLVEIHKFKKYLQYLNHNRA